MKLDYAKALVDIGFYVFPLRENSKLPLITEFTAKATRDYEKLEEWWLDPFTENQREYNIGISTENLAVIDVDAKNGKDGYETLEKLEMFGKEIPWTYEQVTPSGGKHIVFYVSEPIKQGVNVLGNGLDIRAKGGYIVGAGSTIDGKPYSLSVTAPLAPAPQWLIDACGKPSEKSNVLAPENINEESAYKRALHYLLSECPEATAGERNHSAYKAACKVKDFGVDEVTCFSLMQESWPCSPMLDSEELTAVVSSAYKYGNEPIGAASPEASFTPITEEQKLHYLEELNRDHSLVLIEGSYFVIHETVDEKGKPKRNFLNEQAFKRKFSPKTLQKRGTWATEWLDWENRREYQGICFAPEREVKNQYYNLWRGFSISPLPYSKGTAEQKKGFDMFISHARENVCQGNEKLFQWLMGYFAHLIQKPYERPLVTLVFQGSKGVGKNAVIDRIGTLFQGHYKVAHNKRYLTSNFNGHLDSCLCLVLDEAFWSGDKDAEGQLKGLTTSPTIFIERKGKETYEVDNLVRLVIIGNEDWLVPASTDERRYAVFKVGEGNKQDKKFFHEMRILMDEKGGNRILLDYLKTFDLSTVDINDAPKTGALLDQKLSSLEPFEQWWYGRLIEGQIAGCEWPESIDTALFRNDFNQACKEMNIRSRLPSETSLGKHFKKILPQAEKSKRWLEGRTVWVYKLPTLQESRTAWSKFVGQEVIWE